MLPALCHLFFLFSRADPSSNAQEEGLEVPLHAVPRGEGARVQGRQAHGPHVRIAWCGEKTDITVRAIPYLRSRPLPPIMPFNV